MLRIKQRVERVGLCRAGRLANVRGHRRAPAEYCRARRSLARVRRGVSRNYCPLFNYCEAEGMQHGADNHFEYSYGNQSCQLSFLGRGARPLMNHCISRELKRFAFLKQLLRLPLAPDLCQLYIRKSSE